MNDNSPKNIILWFFLALFVFSLVMMGWLIGPFLSAIILSAVVTGIFKPLYTYFLKKLKPAFASFITCLLIFFILFVPISLFVGILSKEAYGLYLMGKSAVISQEVKTLLEANEIIEKANQILSNFNIEITGEQFNQVLSEAVKFVGLFLYQQVGSIAANILSFLVNSFLMLLVIYYFLIDGNQLFSFIINLSPLPDDQDEKLIQKFKDMAGAILIGNGLGGLIQGTLGGLVFSVFGLKSPFLWGVIMALLAFLPIIGIGVVFIPAATYLFLSGRVGAGIFFIIFYIILSGGIEYIFKPKLVGQRVKMHTLLVFFSIIGGLKLFGILGIIYGPLIITAFLTLTDIYNLNYKELVTPTSK